MKGLLLPVVTERFKHDRIMTYFLAASVLIVLLTGCVPPGMSRHDYTVSLINKSGKPISEVVLSGKSLNRAYRHEKLNPVECKTSKEGLCVIPVETTIGDYVNDLNYTKALNAEKYNRYNGNNWKWGFATSILLNAEDPNYFNLPDNRYFSCFDVEIKDYKSGSMPAVSVPNKLIIKLISLKELFCKQSLTSTKDIEDARQKIVTTEQAIRNQVPSNDYEIENLGSSSFKDKDYISININFPVVFNSDKMSRYENIREIIDRVVRGAAGVMNANLGDWCIDGYSIKVHAERQSFSHAMTRTADPLQETLFLEMYMPKEKVNQYAQHNTTGQSLADSSIILLNGERIDVKMY